MRLLTAQEMLDIDRRAITGVGIPSLVLMERAGLQVTAVIRREFPDLGRVLVVAGKGSNGGDGLVVVRHLHLLGYGVDYCLAMGADLKGDAQVQLQILQNLGLEPVASIESDPYTLIVDALLGTGFSPPVRGTALDAIAQINGSGLPVVAVDIPSGLSADSGKELIPAVQAKVTVTFQFPKLCHLLYPASKTCGKLYVANIGIPPSLAAEINRTVLLDVNLPPRPPDAHKGMMGHILLVGGSIGKTGAVILAGKAGTRAGAGLVSVAVPAGLQPALETALWEEMTIPLAGSDRLAKESVAEILALQAKFTAVGVGMGMDRYRGGQELIKELVTSLEQPLLLDADALNNLADVGVAILKARQGITVLTPHVGEFQRLSGLPKEQIIEQLTEVAQEFAQRWGCYLVLKSARTAIATPAGKVYLSVRGGAGMAKGGMGDVLAGILTALLGRGLAPESALLLGVFTHGLAGEIAQAEKHLESLRAIDLVEALPKAWQAIEQKNYPQPFVYLT
ncbi:MAG: NAD(P)H-hydrate dehydratase [Pseudanabaenaceae cyanobacterium]